MRNACSSRVVGESAIAFVGNVLHRDYNAAAVAAVVGSILVIAIVLIPLLILVRTVAALTAALALQPCQHLLAFCASLWRYRRFLVSIEVVPVAE